MQQMTEERKAPIPGRVTAQQAAAATGSAGLGAHARASSKNLQDMREERKVGMANMGAQVFANNNRNTARVQ